MGDDGSVLVHLQAGEIRFKFALLGPQGDLEAAYRAYPPGVRTERVTTEHSVTFSFVPPGVPKIRDCPVRLFLHEPTVPTEDAWQQALLGANVVLLEPSSISRVKEIVVGLGVHAPPPALVFLVPAGALLPEVSAPWKANRVDFSGERGHVIPALRRALRLAFDRLLEDAPAPTEPLVPVAVPRLAAVLAGLEKQRGRPLTKGEVYAAREEAAFVMLSRAGAEAFVRAHGPDLDPSRIWEEWQALSGTT
jgi:hypothetical protein